MEVATGQEGEADTANKDVRTAELPPLWMWKMGCGEGLLPCVRPCEGMAVAVVDKVVR